MERETIGKVVSIKKQLWLKVNTKAFRKGALDGAAFPSIIKVTYKVNDQEYAKRKWISARSNVPFIDSDVKVIYNENKPSKAKIILM